MSVEVRETRTCFCVSTTVTGYLSMYVQETDAHKLMWGLEELGWWCEGLKGVVLGAAHFL